MTLPAFVLHKLQHGSREFLIPVSYSPSPTVKHLGVCDYHDVWHAMRDYSRSRTHDSDDQLWLVEHPPVYTLGRNGDATHITDAGDIPVIHSDRGGQATYHAPGQAVLYTLVDLHRRGLGVRRFVEWLEQAVIGLLVGYGITAARRPGAPGVYVGGRKIAALGLRVSRGHCYHGIALNVNMDLRPFECIVVCGMTGMAVTQIRDEASGSEISAASAGLKLAERIIERWSQHHPPQ